MADNVRRSPLADYAAAARRPRYSLLFALPLLVLYEVSSFALSGSAYEGVRNGADVLLKQLFVSFGGANGLALFNLLLLGAGGVLIWSDISRHPGPLKPRVFLLMLAESTLYALLFGAVVGRLTSLLLQIGGGSLDLPTQLVVSLGAGIYEELLFRVLLTGGLASVLRTAAGMKPVPAAAVAVLVSALIFSAFHYIGRFGDDFTLASFTYRAIAGVLFSIMYVTRGLGITAWTHALYDLLVTMLYAGSR